jgi:hypothetical protein
LPQTIYTIRKRDTTYVIGLALSGTFNKYLSDEKKEEVRETMGHPS